MSFSAFEDYGIYGHGPRSEKSVPKQSTAADDWSRLSERDRADVIALRKCDYKRLVGGMSPVALTYIRRHG